MTNGAVVPPWYASSSKRTIVQVSKLLGHADPAFTLRTYVHLMPGEDGGPLDLGAALGEPMAPATSVN